MGRGRAPRVKFNAQKFDEDVRKHEGTRFNQSKISEFIMGRNATYYCEALKEERIAEEVLEKACKYYELDKVDYIITEETEKKQIQQKADTQNYENVLTYLKGIDDLLRELLAAEKSTQFILNEMKNNLMKSNTNEKAMIEKLEAVEKREQAKHNTYTKFK